jgi:hypothetical protein
MSLRERMQKRANKAFDVLKAFSPRLCLLSARSTLAARRSSFALRFRHFLDFASGALERFDLWGDRRDGVRERGRAGGVGQFPQRGFYCCDRALHRIDLRCEFGLYG